MPYTPPPPQGRQLQTRRSPLASFGAGLILLPALVVASLPTPAAAFDYVPFGTLDSNNLSDTTFEPGQQVTFTVQVKNIGANDTSPNFRHVFYYLSTNSAISFADVALGLYDTTVAASCKKGFLALDQDEELSVTETCIMPALSDTFARGDAYYLGYCLQKVSGEEDQTNNCSNGVLVVINNRDLAVSIVDVDDSTVEPGQAITVTVNVSNVGEGDAAAASTLRYYWSTDASISNADTPLCATTDAVPILAVGNTAQFPKACTVPSPATGVTYATAGATYYVGACVDTQSGEQDTSNNCASRAVTVHFFDWQVSSAAISDTTVGPGQTITLSATVRNAGDLEAGASTLRYYLSLDDALSTSDDTPLCATAQLALSGNSSRDVSMACQLPASLTRGATYYVFACLDAQSVGEGATNNNCSTSSTPLSVGFFDWTVVPGSVSVDDATVEPNQSIALAATVRNVGGVPAGTTTLSFYWSTDSSISTTDTPLCEVAVPSLVADSGSALSAACAVPASATAGDYYVGACVDTQSEESRTDNNCSAGVAVGIDNFDWTVVAGSVSIDNATLKQGQSIALAATVRNVGGVPAGTTTLSFYWSTDTVFTSADTPLCEVAVPSLVADSSSALSATTCAVPASATAGDYYVGACVDTQSEESRTDNNCSAGVAVGIDNFDWIVVAGSVSIDDATLKQGQSIALAATVRNVGGVAAGATTLRFYWSTDTVFTSADTQLCAVVVAGLIADSETTLSAACAVPASATAGDYYVGACVDVLSVESRADNNCAVGVAVGIDNFDWTVAGSVAIDDSTVRPGQSIALGATVRNVGGLSASTTTLSFYWSTDSSISTTDTQLCAVAVPSLVADSGSALSAACAVPASATAGDYYVGACVDTQSGEESVANNCSAGVAVGIDNFDWTVVAGSVSIDDATLKPGQSIALAATVRNVGGEAASTTTLSFHWSTDTVVTSADTQLCEVAVPSLDSDSGATLSAACAVPAAAEDGDYHVGACVDTQSGEESVANNCSAGIPVAVSATSLDVDENGAVETVDATLVLRVLLLPGSIRESLLAGDASVAGLVVAGFPALAANEAAIVGLAVELGAQGAGSDMDVDQNGAVETVDATLVLRVLLLPGSIRESLLAGDASVAGLAVAGFPALATNEAAIVRRVLGLIGN